MVGRWDSRHGRFVYDLVDEVFIIDAMFVNGEGVWLYADDSKRSCPTRSELEISAGVELVCTLIFYCN